MFLEASQTEFRLIERKKRAPLVRIALFITIFVVIGYIFVSIAMIESAMANRFTVICVLFIVYLAFFAWLTTTEYWARNQWIDAAVAIGSIPFTDAMRIAIASQAALTGWDDAQLTTGNAVIIVVFVSIIMTTSFRWFALWAAIFGTFFLLRLLGADGSVASKYFSISVFAPVLLASLWSKWQVDRSSFDRYAANLEAERQKARAEDLLYNVLPQPIADRLRQGATIADAYSDASVVFVDMVGSSQLARQLSPRHLIEVLNAVFSVGDHCAARHNVEKVKTIGDAYLAVAGAAVEAGRGAAIRFAADFIAGVDEIAAEMKLPLSLRIGIHTGPVIGGVIGETRMSYDYWGDTMNVAARVQAAAEPGGIAVTEPTYFASREFQTFAAPRLIMLKGVGETKVYDAII